ncbi:hypothetical protein U1Q18_015780, partial [Sarracenia purpurea var. burkii]
VGEGRRRRRRRRVRRMKKTKRRRRRREVIGGGGWIWKRESDLDAGDGREGRRRRWKFCSDTEAGVLVSPRWESRD